MTAMVVPLAVEVPGEDVAFPPSAPLPARAHLAHLDGVTPIPTWESLTPSEREEHRDECADTCLWCEPHRAFGTCPACEAWNAEPDDQGESRCCHAPVFFPSPEEDGPDRWIA